MKIHWVRVLPIIILAVIASWHLFGYYTMDALGSDSVHYGTIGLVMVMALTSLFFRNTTGDFSHYAEGLIEPMRAHLLGGACLLLGGLHFVSMIETESIFLQMGFLVLVLAFFEAAGISNRFIRAYSEGTVQVTENTLKRLVLNQMGMLAMVYVLSVLLLYMSLMVVVGFTDTWTVAFLAAVMILALAFMTMARRL